MFLIKNKKICYKMNYTDDECFISNDDVELAQTIAIYTGLGIFALFSCCIARLCCCKEKRCC